MAVPAKLFGQFPQNLGGGNLLADGPMDILSDVLKGSLHTATWTPNQSTNEVKADATNELATASGYAAATIAGKTFAASALITTMDATDITWTFTAALTFRYFEMWDDTPTAPADPLILFSDTGADQTVGSASGIDFVWQWNNTGTPAVFQFTVA